jgi:hypothetical protein
VTRLRAIVFDSVHPAALARFWAEVLDGYAVRAYDSAEIARLAKAGRTPETDPSVAVDGPGPMLWFQETGSAKTERNRVHLDVAGAARSAEVARLCALGATIRTERADHTVMLDPEGNEFCVVDV